MSPGLRPASSPWRPSRAWLRWTWPKLPWFLALAAVLVVSCGGFVSWDAEANGAFLVYSLLLLTGPAGYAPLAYMPWGLPQLLGSSAETFGFSLLINLVTLATTIAAGYWQWFVLFPWIRERWSTEIPVFRSTNEGSEHE